MSSSPSPFSSSCVRPVFLVGMLLFTLAAGPTAALAYTVYGFEDAFGMLHLSKTKANDDYLPLYETEGPDMNIGYEKVMDILKRRQAVHAQTQLDKEYIHKYASFDSAGSLAQAVRPFLGAPYTWGGESLAGLDCSAFTMLVFRRLGRKLPRNSQSQAMLGASVDLTCLQAGDLLFFDADPDRPGIDHVAIYMGGNRMAHASSREGGVVIQPLRGSRYFKWWVAAKRIPQR